MNTRLSQAISKGPISQHRSCLSSDALDSSDLGGIGGPVRAQPSSSPYTAIKVRPLLFYVVDALNIRS